MEKLEKCIRFDQQCEPLKKKYGLTYWQCMKLRNELFQDFIEATEKDYYLEICIEDYIKWIKGQVDRQDCYLPLRKEDEKKAD